MGRIKGDEVSMMISQTRRQINTFEKKEKNKKKSAQTHISKRNKCAQKKREEYR